MFSSSSAQRQQIVVGGCKAMIKREEEGFGALKAGSEPNLLNHSAFCQLQMDFHARSKHFGEVDASLPLPVCRFCGKSAQI